MEQDVFSRTARTTRTDQFVHLTDGRLVAASEIVELTPCQTGGWNVQFRGSTRAGHVANLAGLGVFRKTSGFAFHQGRRTELVGYWCPPGFDQAVPVWGLAEIPLDSIVASLGGTS